MLDNSVQWSPPAAAGGGGGGSPTPATWTRNRDQDLEDEDTKSGMKEVGQLKRVLVASCELVGTPSSRTSTEELASSTVDLPPPLPTGPVLGTEDFFGGRGGVGNW